MRPLVYWAAPSWPPAVVDNVGVLTMPIIGTATTPFPTASFGAIPTAIDLGSVPFGLPVSLVIPPVHSAGFPVNNSGGLPLTLASAFTGTNPGDFRLVGSGLRGGPVGCPGVFPVGAGCTLIIAFVPQGEGTRSATFALTSDDPAHPVIATILLTGFDSPPLPPPAPAPIMSLYNVTDRWKNVAEPGWSLNIANHPTINAADQLVASWNLFDVDTTDMWLTLKNGSWITRTNYTGNLFHRLGSPYNAPFAAAQGSEAIVGTATLDFSSASTATFTYTVSAVTVSKTIGRAVF